MLLVLYYLFSSIVTSNQWKWRCESHSVVSDSLRPHGLYNPWTFPDKNIGVGSLSLLQGIFPTQGSNPGLAHCWWILYQLSHKGSPRILEWVAYPFSSRSSPPRNRTTVSCIVGGVFTNWANLQPFLLFSTPIYISDCLVDFSAQIFYCQLQLK